MRLLGYNRRERKPIPREFVRVPEWLKDPVGLKKLHVPDAGLTTRTPYGAKEMRRRRAENRVAKQARKANRGA